MRVFIQIPAVMIQPEIVIIVIKTDILCGARCVFPDYFVSAAGEFFNCAGAADLELPFACRKHVCNIKLFGAGFRRFGNQFFQCVFRPLFSCIT